MKHKSKKIKNFHGSQKSKILELYKNKEVFL